MRFCFCFWGGGTQAAGASAAAAAVAFSGVMPAAADGPYSLPDLPYAYEALEPHIDAATMKVQRMITACFRFLYSLVEAILRCNR